MLASTLARAPAPRGSSSGSRHPCGSSVRTRRVGRLRAGAAAMPAAETVVQLQLEAYNRRDLDAFMALLADDCVATDELSGAVLAQGAAALRERYRARFATPVHSELLGRLCLGPVVVDREIITGLPGEASEADCLATYLVRDGRIARMSFVWQPRVSGGGGGAPAAGE